MEQLHAYVPTVSMTKEFPVEGTGDSVLLDDYNFHRILVGGDQLTAVRCRGSAAAHSDHQTSLERLQDSYSLSGIPNRSALGFVCCG